MRIDASSWARRLHAASGDDGLRLGRTAEYAVMTIDRMLPGKDGLSIIRCLRDAGVVTITGDRDLLFDALANLVDNAIKYGQEGGRVRLDIERRDDHAILCICDDAPGIPEHEHENVFKRFYRLEGSRCTPGNGLGLSLVAAVARLHNAPIKLLCNGPGLKVEWRFLLSAA